MSDPGAGAGGPALLGRLALPVLAAAVLLAVLLAVLVAGAAGLLVVLSAVTVGAGLGAALGVPGAPARRTPRRAAPPVHDAAFRAYRQVAEQLSWAAVSPRHYDLVTRPLFARLAASRLADHHGVDLVAEPGRARALVGPDVWPWVDPTGEPSRDGQPPGIGRDTLTRVVERLEQL